MMHRWSLRLAVLATLVNTTGCDVRPVLARSPAFGFFREPLIAECCACLAQNGTAAPGATCAQTQINPDGTLTLVGNDPQIPVDAAFDGDVRDDERDDGEIPCICNADQSTCEDRLRTGATIRVPGACIDQTLFAAPCEEACLDVLTFDPPPTTEG